MSGDLSLWTDEVEPTSSNTNNAAATNLIIEPIVVDEYSNNLRTADGDSSETHIFFLDKVQFELESELIHFSVSNNILVMLLLNFKVLIVDLLKASDITEVEISGSQGKPYKTFMDPTGKHILVTTTDLQIFYYHNKLSKFVKLNKLKGQLIEAIAFDKTLNINSINTGNLLLGTSTGTIYELLIEPNESYFSKEEKFLRKVFSLPEKQPITGIYYEIFPGFKDKVVVFVSTDTKLYQFIGSRKGSSNNNKVNELEPKFLNYFNNAGKSPQIQQLDKEEISSGGILQLLAKNSELDNMSVATALVWSTEQGMFYTNLVFGSQKSGESVYDNSSVIPYPNPAVIPIAIVATEFHFLLLFPDHLLAMSRLDGNIVFKQSIPTLMGKSQQAYQLTVDPIKKTVWIHTRQAMYELVITEEDRNVWRYYLANQQFTEALQHVKTKEHKNVVLKAQANQYFNSGRYQLAANYFGQSDNPVEETILKFLNKEEFDPLRAYLLLKLESLHKNDVTQTLMLTTLIVELYLSKLNHMEEVTNRTTQPEQEITENPRNSFLIQNRISFYSNVSEVDQDSNRSHHIAEESQLLTDELLSFLTKYRAKLDTKVVYYLLHSHGRRQELVQFAELTQDFDKLIHLYLNHHQYPQALHTLAKQDSHQLYYKFAPLLIQHTPQELVTLLMKNTQLNPKLLIPALLKYDHSKIPTSTSGNSNGNGQNQAIRYLQFVTIKLKNTDPAIHNLLVSLYASQTDSSEASLLQFLVSDASDRHYDLDLALRLCTRFQRKQSTVLLLGFLGLYEEAVTTALQFGDLELAKINADKVDDNDELRKSLWLQVAKYVIVDLNDIKGAITLLQQCELLKIEDLLPFFPDFVLIDDFKEEICTALEEYNVHIEEIKMEMDEATRSSNMIRQAITNQKSRFVTLVPDEKCALCHLPVLSRQFYVFPCQHAFHSDCLIQHVATYLKPTEVKALKELQSKLTKHITLLRIHVNKQMDTSQIANADGNLGEEEDLVKRRELIDTLKEELDDTIASDCPLCGTLMIQSIQIPFVSELDFEAQLSWII